MKPSQIVSIHHRDGDMSTTRHGFVLANGLAENKKSKIKVQSSEFFKPR